ncbi:YitT family protein [Streptomyces sp. NPDC001530]|uniref:membrane protein YczE n=1 Tax=Streptomyces sp. NPDC001530 TaxID=3364582 RepID=UPI0036AF3FD6
MLFGISLGVMVRAGLGVNPWSVLYEGVGRYATDLSFGTIGLIISLLVLLMWIPLRQRPGVGTIANVFLVAVGSDFALAVLPVSENAVYTWTLLLGGIAANGLSIAIYVGARLGPGPRDGLMTGLSERFEGSIRLVRTGLEVAVLAIGWMLGGTVGIGTVLYAVAIGPLTQFFLPLMAVRSPEEPRDRAWT